MAHKNQQDQFAERLNKALNALNVPKRGRAKYIQENLPMDISVVAIRKWLNGESIPDTKKLSAVAGIAGTSVESLLGMKGLSNNDADNELANATLYLGRRTRKVPILSTVQAGKWTEAVNYSEIGEEVEWIETTANVGDGSFAVKVKGSSMTNPNGNLSLPDGSIAIVQPDPDPENGKIVVAMLEGSDEATIKKLEKEGPFKHLVPLNPAYNPIPINGNCRIIGFVKQVIIELD
ncbi:LexA family protein [Celerinatantimonas sp. MCCC 1A17872]|uniref:LexA family protein n=1 Tax=Celerinatantimonas sp. MCCC 1A17872 TaxID=3177514 RepID=UPI0038BFB85D